MTRTSRFGAVLTVLTIHAVPVWAHHSVAAEFDTANRGELIKQWTNVLGAPETPAASDTVDGQKHAIYKDSKGAVVVETYEVAGLQHGLDVRRLTG